MLALEKLVLNVKIQFLMRQVYVTVKDRSFGGSVLETPILQSTD